MIEYLKPRIFPLLIAFSALSVSLSAAFYSVSGLSKLFAGAAFAVIVMAASLEIAKLVIASLLYQYRKNLPKLLKWYLSLACIVLILITSMGIYGFLSAAYQETAAKAGSIDSKITLIEVKRDNIKEQLAVYNEEKSSINITQFEYDKFSGINWHNDDGYTINYSFYMHDTWNNNWGGETLIDTNRGLPLVSYPYPNTLLTIKNNIQHKVCPVTGPKKRKVLQIRGIFYE